MKRLCVTLLLLLPNISLADEWGSWDDLPDNLLQETDALELMNELDRLFASNYTSVDGDLDSWLNQLNLRLNISEEELEALLDELDESEAERLEDWLEDQLELQEEALEIKEEDDDEFDEDDDELEIEEEEEEEEFENEDEDEDEDEDDDEKDKDKDKDKGRK